MLLMLLLMMMMGAAERLTSCDRLLEDSVRICDTREYLDTMTLAGNLLEDGEEFLNLMEVVTRGGFLTHPCKGNHDRHHHHHYTSYIGTIMEQQRISDP